MIWFSSDHHFDHANILVYDERPFNSLKHMNEELVGRWNAVVKPEDTVFYLGDFSLSKRAAAHYLPMLNGEKHLIAGNHDACHPAHAKKSDREQAMRKLYYDCGFKSIALEDEIVIGLERVKMHHMPYRGDHTERRERYANWRPQDTGQWLLHGHVHTAWKQRGKMINVGVCHWNYAPVSIDEIRALIAAGEVAQTVEKVGSSSE